MGMVSKTNDSSLGSFDFSRFSRLVMLQHDKLMLVTLGRSRTGNYVSVNSKQLEMERNSRLFILFLANPLRFFKGFWAKLICFRVGKVRMGNSSSRFWSKFRSWMVGKSEWFIFYNLVI